MTDATHTSHAPAIRLKRVYEEADEHDGVRVLVDRLWPRGVSKDAAHLDAWIKNLGPSDEPARVASLRVLAVDDEPSMTKAVVRMLRPAGHIVSAACSGEEALEKLATETFDVVISDLGMGLGMNGWVLADAVKQRWPNVRFLLATGWGATIDPAEARTRGVEAVLAKPYRPVDLDRALASPGTVQVAA